MTVATAPTFDTYYNKAMAQVQPYMNRGIEDTKAGLVDQGLLSSTAGQGKLADVRSQYLAQTVGMAQNQANTDRTFGENRRQFNAQQAARIYELLMSGYLGRRQLQGNNKGLRVPVDPKSFGTYQRFTGDPMEQRDPMMDMMPMEPPRDMRGMGMVGDPREQWARYTENPVSDLSERNMNAQVADAAAGRALQRAQLDLDRERLSWQKRIAASEQDKADDPWAQLANLAQQNRMTDTDKVAPGMQLALFPKDILGRGQTDFGLDVVSIAQDENHPDNMKAIALLKILYPGGGWRKLLGLADADQSVSGAGTWRNPDGSPAAQQNWQPEANRGWLDRIFNDKFITWDEPASKKFFTWQGLGDMIAGNGNGSGSPRARRL